VIQVDGAHHFWGADGQQASNDSSHEQAILSARGVQVKGLLRLHYRDGNDVWERCISWALYHARHAGVQCFVAYSPLYGRQNLMVPVRG
jgi:hypothetical protein